VKKILVANRGEIALRVMRSAKEMDIKTVAVYSDADDTAPHVQFADEAVNIGPAPSNQSYLAIDKIIDAAKTTGADGIHPGYGFLSENAGFATAIEKAGIIFIGPSAKSMRIMGNKLKAKQAVKKYNIPMVAGTSGQIKSSRGAAKIAKSIGFPVLIKAAAGGGGRGMRVVKKEKELAENIERAISEAKSAFGDGAIFIEKYIASPRHIEIQVMGDKHGNIVHLFERECSIQRRHQKVIEEAPSSILTEELRFRMGESAVSVARACSYGGAGTVEFLLDKKMNYYFLEMNTRLQVEHPVTEMITGIDLVKEQIKVAEGKKLSFSQNDININGHALELRVYAEDSSDNFLPNVGNLTTYQPPQGPGIRIDDGYRQGMDIPIYYDPMIAKLITHGKNRKEAIKKMIRAIDEYHIAGVKTTLPFGKFVMEHKAFKSGNFDTHFIDKYINPNVVHMDDSEESLVAAVIAVTAFEEKQKQYIKPPNKVSADWRKNRLVEE